MAKVWVKAQVRGFLERLVNKYSREGSSNFREVKEFLSDIFADSTRGEIVQMTNEVFAACSQPRIGSVPAQNLVKAMMRAYKDEKGVFVKRLENLGLNLQVNFSDESRIG